MLRFGETTSWMILLNTAYFSLQFFDKCAFSEAALWLISVVSHECMRFSGPKTEADDDFFKVDE